VNLVAHSVRSKGGRAFVRRIGSIVSRFGVTAAKTDQNLRVYVATLREFGCSATFPITAVVLGRHPALIRRLSDDGVEFAVHGYIHTDHTLLSRAEQRRQMAHALDVFRAAGVDAQGFRSPYLRGNEDTVAAADSLGFRYISNETLYYDVLDRAAVEPDRWIEYEKALNLYSAVPATQALARPRMCGHLIEIPVSMPDDEILVDRLGYADGEQIGKVWANLVNLTYTAGDLLTLQLHPERGIACRQALSMALANAGKKERPVWLAQLREIAIWWKRRAGFRLTVGATGDGRWRITGPADPDATILLQNLTSAEARHWHGSYALLEGNDGIVESAKCPVIGLAPDAGALKALLEEEGYAVHIDRDPANYALYLNQTGELTQSEQAAIIRQVEQSPAPLVRIGRWPRGARSAISVTGDIDALTLGDFLLRAWEVR
jgi:peptidoglycan/xylan/chitin deacetylase (PgdA/CDA1 family)